MQMGAGKILKFMKFKKFKRRIKICSAGETLNYGGESIKFYEALKFTKQ